MRQHPKILNRKYPGRVKQGTQVKTLVGPTSPGPAAIRGHVTAPSSRGVKIKKKV